MSSLSNDQLAQILWDYNNLNQPLKKSEAILVLCSNDIRVAQYAAELYLQGWSPLLIFSGNVGALTEGMFDKPEAEVFANIALQMGVPKDRILIENKATNTSENIILTEKMLAELHKEISSFIVVQKPFMGRRAFATFKKVWPVPEIIVTAPPISFSDYSNEVISQDELINTLVGDTQRIKVYADKGFQIPQTMPDNVWSAYEDLVECGFDKHLI